MDRFLEQCAKYILNKHAHELQDICLVFPNRRSGVFFTAYLHRLIEKPVISPCVTTISELISGSSPFYSADKLLLVSLLYEEFKKHTGTRETFDEFYFWGEILLNDFQDTDRYLVKANDLFTTISDLKTIDSIFDYLTDEQKKALEDFWGSLAKPDRKEFEKRYISLWEKLYPVYTGFREILEEKKLAYGGMADRWVAEHLDSPGLQFPFVGYYFIGLNVLNACEKKLFNHLRNEGKAFFLWDYDEWYVNNPKHEAGRFMRDNLKMFPPPEDFDRGKAIKPDAKSVVFTAVPSLYGQAQAIPQFLEDHRNEVTGDFDNTAVILADESLLFPALGAIPETCPAVNVTMGYPVKNSVIHGFVMLLANLVKNSKKDKRNRKVAYYRYVTDLLNHQLISGMEKERKNAFVSDIRKKNRITIPLEEIDFSPFHSLVFTIPDKVGHFSEYFIHVLGELLQWVKRENPENKILPELIVTVLYALERMKYVISGVISDRKEEISPAIYFSLFNQILGQSNVAFEGEPLSGMQVMGILETRCIDFENVMILGFNENKWPRTSTAPSFIPHNLRKAFGLPGIDEQDAMYAYYFYRLVQRAKNVTATYSVTKEGINTGELSRYGFQLVYGSEIPVKRVSLGFSFRNDPVRPLTIRNSQDKINDLLSRITEEHPLSPSAINLWLYCRLRFYFRYYMQLPEPEEVKDEIDSLTFGNIFHEVVEVLYGRLKGKPVRRNDLERLASDTPLLENEILKSMEKNFFMEKDPEKKSVVPQGKNLLIFENIKIFLKQLLKTDAEITPFSVVSLEDRYKTRLQVMVNGSPVTIWIGGKIDRIDRMGDTLRILDYKTGIVTSRIFAEIQDLFVEDKQKPLKEILQAMIYTWMVRESFPEEKKLQPGIYGLRELFSDQFSPEVRMKNGDFSFLDLQEELVDHLSRLVSVILSPDTEFTQTQWEDKCTLCPYRIICQRSENES